ncbi:hypothetical protein F4779DRAFT_625616 [Xylariaceae sp. FL0662B]|nr:hypothetical protein F4779DRAFT_625616 [Xylariaceae sp. FL0662B]
MPPINHPAMSAGIIAVTVAVAAAIAVYESPELQRMAADLRRRIAIALHSLGEEISPAERENLFNRPEDAEGFLQSRGLGAGSEPGVDADDETRRRQREELMYWNSVREAKMEKERLESEKRSPRPRSSRQGSSFDDFLEKDTDAEKGAYVFHTGSEFQNSEGLVRRRGDGARGLNYSSYSNPFADEHGIDEDVAFENSLMDPEKEEVMSDVYSATELGNKAEPSRSVTLPADPALIEVEEHAPTTQPEQQQPSEEELGPDEYVTAGQDDRHDAYSSIQAWANNTSDASFYSPLPVSPEAPLSEPELISEGALTPADSGSVAGSGVDIGDEVASARSYSVMSDDDGIMTPTSWTEVGSVTSESEAGQVHA